METNYLEIFRNVGNEINEINKRAKAEIAKLKQSALKASTNLFAEICLNCR